MKQQITNEELRIALRRKELEVLAQVKRAKDIATLMAIKKYGRILGWCATIPSAVVLVLKWFAPIVFASLRFQLDNLGVLFTLVLGGVCFFMSIRSEHILKKMVPSIEKR